MEAKKTEEKVNINAYSMFLASPYIGFSIIMVNNGTQSSWKTQIMASHSDLRTGAHTIRAINKETTQLRRKAT